MNDNLKIIKDEKNDEIDLLSIIRLVFSKFHWLIISGIAFAICVFSIVNFLIAPTYESRVSFYVNNGNNVSHSQPIQNSDLQAAESLATTYSKILESNSVFDAVLNALGSDNKLSRAELSSMVSVSVVDDTQLLEVVVSSNDAKLACRIAECFAEVSPTEIIRITKAGSVEIVDSPEVASNKSSPKTVFDIIIGFIIGVVVAAVIVIFKSLSDTTIYTSEDVENFEKVTVLGQIPEIDVTDDKYTSWNLVKGGTITYESRQEEI